MNAGGIISASIELPDPLAHARPAGPRTKSENRSVKTGAGLAEAIRLDQADPGRMLLTFADPVISFASDDCNIMQYNAIYVHDMII
jgi:hypothetical protein